MKSRPERPPLTANDVGAAIHRAVSMGKRILDGVTHVGDVVLLVSSPFALMIDKKKIPELRDVPADELDGLTLSPGGTTIILEKHNIYIEALGLIAAAINAHRRDETLGTVAEMLFHREDQPAA